MDLLTQEIEQSRKAIKTDNYSMSIGEIVNLYKAGDIKLDPAFQRLFRWEEEQKTAFVESILLGIPIPEIFVAQDAAGKWTVVDGVQRISTILQMVGELPKYAPLKLTKGSYLSALDGKLWRDLPEDAQRLFKRAKLSINIIITEQGADTEYEVFKRLNTGGTHLEDQEIRNCLIIMRDEEIYQKINDLKEYPPFKTSLQLTEKKLTEEYHMELIIRYLIAVLGKTDYKKYSLSTIHMAKFLDEETKFLIDAIHNKEFDFDAQIAHFKKVFDWLVIALSGVAFKTYNPEKNAFDGAFSVGVFEAVVPGVALNFDRISKLDKSSFQERIIQLNTDPKFIDAMRHGVRSPLRYKTLTELSKEFFSR